MDPQSNQNEQESPRFYHLELYDSSEDLAMFSEEPFRRRDLALHEKTEASARAGQQNSSQEDAEELARSEKDAEVELAASSESTAADPGSSSAADLAKSSHLATKTMCTEQSTEKPVPGKDSQDDKRGSSESKAATEAQPFKPNSQEEGNDSYCITCCVPIRAQDDQGSRHDEHEVIPLFSVVEIAKVRRAEVALRWEDEGGSLFQL